MPSEPIDPLRQTAIALKAEGWEKARGAVPVITAIGKGKNAEQILRLAFDNNVKVRQDADLAAILSAMEIDCPVPLEALDTVSQILAYLYGVDYDAANSPT